MIFFTIFKKLKMILTIFMLLFFALSNFTIIKCLADCKYLILCLFILHNLANLLFIWRQSKKVFFNQCGAKVKVYQTSGVY